MKITKDTPLKVVLEIGKECDMSGHCCKFGGGFVLESDILPMAEHLGITNEEFKEKYLERRRTCNTDHYKLKSKKKKSKKNPYSPCVFLKGNLCSIHEVKPLHCRVGSCCSKYGEQLSKWFAYNYFVDPYDKESHKEWETYLRDHGGTKNGKNNWN